MGYTHHWEILDPEAWSAAFPLIVHDTHIIISHSGVPVEGPQSSKQPVAPTVSESEGIHLNGFHDAHEPFILVPDVRTVPLDRRGRHAYRRFCKTARKPYDLVVTAILIRAKLHAGNALGVWSDGTWGEWTEVRDFVESVWGEGSAICPLERGEDDKDEDEREQNADADVPSEGTVTDDEGSSIARNEDAIESADFLSPSNTSGNRV